MKKLVLVLLALVLPTTLLAMDLNPGTIELSGRTGFNLSDRSYEEDGAPDVDVTSTELRIDGSYYILRNLGVGLFVQYESEEIDQEGFPGLDTSSVIIGPQVTYHFPLSPQFNLFVNGAVGYAAAEVNNRDADGYAFEVGGGLKYFLKNNISINGTLAYQFMTLEADDTGRDVDFSGAIFGVGLSVYF